MLDSQQFENCIHFSFSWCCDVTGHSRTIIGVEHLKDGTVRLLVFDPSHSKTQMELFNNTATATNGMRLIRRPLVAMKARQYQIVAIAGIIETDQEFQVSTFEVILLVSFLSMCCFSFSV